MIFIFSARNLRTRLLSNLLILIILGSYSFSFKAVYAEGMRIALPTISVIIDDVGDSKLLGLRAANLPNEVALSILPHTPFSQSIAKYGHNRGMDILLHQPMESKANVRLLGPGALFLKMNRQQFSTILEDNINAVPFVIGINNHMGSLLTEDHQKMNWLMSDLKARGMFFIDSRTTAKSIAQKTAQHWQIPTIGRKVFLDHEDDPKAIAIQFQRLIRLAKKYGHAIAIGHPRKNTLNFLEQNLNNLTDSGVTIISPSNIMQLKFPQNRANNRSLNFSSTAHFYNRCYQIYNDDKFNIRALVDIEARSSCLNY